MEANQEQIKQICEKVFDGVQKEMGCPENVGKYPSTFNGTQKFYDLITKNAITEWEKIRGEIEKIDHLNAPVKYKEIFINNTTKPLDK